LLAVLRRGSLSAAARAVGLTQPTIGRHIDELEAGLGVALFTRSPGGLLPTARAAAESEPRRSTARKERRRVQSVNPVINFLISDQQNLTIFV
jgi:molybdenum-dependent DNA-binding transcriptional regulator ModE